MQIPAQATAAAGGKQWIESTTSNSTASSPFGTSGDPAQALSLIRSVSSSVTTVGSESISGTPTTHYRAVVDLTKATAEYPSEASENNKLTQEMGTSVIPIDLWVDAQHRPRQLHEAFTVKGLPSGSAAAGQPQIAQQFPVNVSITMTLSDFGVPVHVTPPPASEVAVSPALGSATSPATTAPPAP